MIELCRLRQSERYEISSDDAKPSQAMGQPTENLPGVRFPWSWHAASRLMTSLW